MSYLRFPDPILGVDPGPVRSGYAWLQANAVLDSGTVPNEELIDHVLGDPLPIIAIERFEARGMAIGDDSIRTILWTGRFIQATRDPDAVILVKRSAAKIHLCGTNRAKDANVRQALIDLLGEPGTKKSQGATYGVHGDAWAALAVAVTANAVRTAPHDAHLSPAEREQSAPRRSRVHPATPTTHGAP